MADEVSQNGEMLSRNIAISIINDLGLDAEDETIEPIADAAHRLLEAGVADITVQDTLCELLAELHRAGSLSPVFEEAGFGNEDSFRD